VPLIQLLDSNLAERRMLIDKNKNKNKVMTQAITEAAAIASRVEPGGNMTCAQVCQKHGKAVSVGAVTSLSQSTVGFFPLKGSGYPTHFCEYCPLSSIVLSCCCSCARCVRLFYIDTTTFLFLFMQTLCSKIFFMIRMGHIQSFCLLS